MSFSFSFSCRAWLSPSRRFGFRGAGRETLEIDFGGYDVAHLFLQFVDGKCAVEDDEVVGVDHFVVLLEDAGLEEFETFGALVGEAEVHAGFVIFQFGAAAEDAVDGDFERGAEIKVMSGTGAKR